MSRRLVIVPRWGGNSGSDWYPWISALLQSQPSRPFDPVLVADLPDPAAPRVDTWPRAIAELLGDDPSALASTFVIGHSVGCQALLHAIAALPPGTRLAGMLAVAGWWRVDRPWPAIVPWQEQIPDLARVRAALPAITLLLSDDDPFTADHALNASTWRERLGARCVLVPGARHFNGAQEPAVLDALIAAAT